MEYVIIILMLLFILFSIVYGFEWIMKDFTEEEKEEAWKNLFNGFNEYKQ